MPPKLCLLGVMLAARISAHTFLTSEICKQSYCAVKNIFPGGVASDQELLQEKVRH